MSETVMPEGVNININNSDSSEGSSSFIDKILNIGYKLLVPVLLVFALVAVLVIVKVVLPLVGIVTDTVTLPGVANLFPPFTTIIVGLGSLGGWIFGR